MNKRHVSSKLEDIQNQKRSNAKTPFTDEQFDEIWQKLIDKYQSEKRIRVSSNMDLLEKKRIDETNYELTFASESSKRPVEDELTSIVTYLRVGLDNFHISFNCLVNEQLEVLTTFKSEDDKLKDMCEKFPIVSQMIQEFHLKIKNH